MPFKSQVTSDAQSKNRAKKKKYQNLAKIVFIILPVFLLLLQAGVAMVKYYKKGNSHLKKKNINIIF
jgi:hypothetical protein